MEQLNLFTKCNLQTCKNWTPYNNNQHSYCDKHFVKHWLRFNDPIAHKAEGTRKKNTWRKIPHNRIARNLRMRIKDLIKVKRGATDFSHRIGLTSKELRDYLEKQFHSGMAWQNYGKLWHVDHIKPIKMFNLLDKQDLLKVNHYTNLQPMLATDNMKKGAKYVTTV